ncbi:MAG: hypothetical protein R3F59_17710 [Myxococcota bacterium]
MIGARWTARLVLLAWGIGFAGCTAEPAPAPPAVEDAPEELVVFPPAPDTPAAEADTWYADCGPGRFPVDRLLAPLVDGLAATSTSRTARQPRRVARLLRELPAARPRRYLASACPAAAAQLPAPPGIAHWVAGERPAECDAEGSAQLAARPARWFEGARALRPRLLRPVMPDDTGWDDDDDDGLPPGLARVRSLLKPGTVLWFSRGQPLARKGTGQLFSRLGGNRIDHVGVVVDVVRDGRGRVVGYSMFHGRNAGVPASVTTDHRVGGVGGGPPFGNGGQYLVGLAALLPPAAPP